MAQPQAPVTPAASGKAAGLAQRATVGLRLLVCSRHEVFLLFLLRCQHCFLFFCRREEEAETALVRAAAHDCREGGQPSGVSEEDRGQRASAQSRLAGTASA